MPNAVLERLASEREQLTETIDNALAAAEAEERDPSEAEREILTRSRERLTQLEPIIVQLVEEEERRTQARDAREVLERARRTAPPAPAAPPDPTQSTELVVYRRFAEYAYDELITRYDQLAQRAGMGARDRAQERLTRAVANTITTDIPGLLPPQWITEIMQVIDASRPLVEASRRIPLTSGKIHYPRITQRPKVDVQAAEKTEVASQTMKVEMVEKVASTYAGAGDLSWQAINWSTPDALGLWFQLAAEAYAERTEKNVADLMATIDQLAPIAVASNDLAGWYGAFAAAAVSVYNATKRRVNTVACSLDVAASIGSLVGNTVPQLMASGAFSLSTLAGNVAGLRIVSSPELAAGSAYVGDVSSLLTAETPGAPVELRAVEPSIAGMEVGVIGAFLSELIEDAAWQKLTPPASALSAPAPSGGATGGK